MPDYRRLRVPGGCYFFTVNLYDRRRRLLVDHINALRAAVREVRARHPFAIDAWVVLPNHMHCIWTLPDGDAAYPMRWRRIKTRFTFRIAGTGDAPIWQRGYWEHTIRSDADYANHVAYIHYNPVKHGYVSRVRDWPYSTFHDAVAYGIVPPDWAGDVGHLDTTYE